MGSRAWFVVERLADPPAWLRLGEVDPQTGELVSFSWTDSPESADCWQQREGAQLAADTISDESRYHRCQVVPLEQAKQRATQRGAR